MSDFMHEINDDLRAQKLREFWQENGNWIIGGAILAVIMTGAMTFWRGHVEAVNERQTGQLMATMNDGTVESLQKYAVESNHDHALIARFMAAGIEVKRNDREKAAAIYDDIANMRGTDKLYKSLARLLAATQRLDTADPKMLHAEFEDLSGHRDPWRFSALEMDALVYSREGKMKEAADTLVKIYTSTDAPTDVRARAMSLHDLYASAVPEEKPAAAPVAAVTDKTDTKTEK